jgi:IMP cyclohydrolase
MSIDIYSIESMGNRLNGNAYPGRGIVLGQSADGKNAVFAYFIMGRSVNSRNRVFVECDGGEVKTHPFDASKVEDPSLIIYSPIRVCGNNLLVTNGDQTDPIYDFVKDGKSFKEALETREFEPDGPNWIPRISALLSPDGSYKMSILKSADAEGSACARYTYEYPGINGVGHFLHTYQGDGKPLPTFCGEPARVSVPADLETLTSEVWNNLNEDNRISLYTCMIDLATGEIESRMINKHQ